MKKLMIAALAAATVAGAYAEAEAVKIGYVYDMAMVLKTTMCSGKATTGNAICTIEGDKDIVTYRKQVTVKINGVFWGCGCEVIGCPTDNIDYTKAEEDADNNGYFFWGTYGKEIGVWDAQDFDWTVLNVVGKKAQNVEGSFTLKLGDGIELTGAGYGTASIRKVAECIAEDGDDLTDYNYIKSMKGYVTGSFKSDLTADDDEAGTGCFYCGGTETTGCKAWAFCAGCTTADPTVAAAFGSFTLKYNATASKKVRNGKSVVEADSKIKANVLRWWERLLATEDPTPVP